MNGIALKSDSWMISLQYLCHNEFMEDEYEECVYEETNGKNTLVMSVNLTENGIDVYDTKLLSELIEVNEQYFEVFDAAWEKAYVYAGQHIDLEDMEKDIQALLPNKEENVLE